MAQGQIYLIINKQDGKKYVGQTTRGMNKEWQDHIQMAMRLSKKPLHKAMRKCGNHNFMIRELCECHVDELNDKELFYIEKFNTSHEYNADVIEEEENKTITEPIIKKEEKWGFMLEENRYQKGAPKTKVMSVNVETGKEIIWDSITEAAIELCGSKESVGNIIRAMKKGHKCHGHLWKRLERSRHRIPIYGVNKITWERTRVFDSIRDAVRILGNGTDSSMAGIRRSIKHPRKYSWKGHYWFKI